MRNNEVAITYKEGAFLNAKKALGALDLSWVKGKSVLIKPNQGRVARKVKGINTHPEAVAGVIEALREAGAGDLAIGESPIVGVDVMEAFEASGVAGVAEKYGVPLVNFDKEKPVKKEVPGSRVLKTTKICGPVFEYDVLLSLPVSKCHMHTGVTLGIKNLKGCLYRHEKVRYHQLEYDVPDQYPEKTLDSAISDLATVLLPDITVIDGFIGMEGLGPSGGEPVSSDFAVASLNPVGADIYGCLMMGFKPSEVHYLSIIAGRMNFSINPADYKVLDIGKEYKNHVTVYQRPPTKVSIKYPNVVLYDNESCSACLSTVMLFLKRFHSDMSQYLFEDGKLYLGIGKGVDKENPREGTVFVGNCTRKCHVKGKFTPGCPPVPSAIYKTITGEVPGENEPDIQ